MPRKTMAEIIAAYHIDVGERHDKTSVDQVASSLGPLSGQKLFAPLVKAAFEFNRKIGLQTAGEETQTFAAPYDKIVAGLLMAINREHLVISQYFDTSAGCFVEVALPTDMLSLGGTMTFDVDDGKQSVVGKFTIPGQRFSWDKGKSTITRIFATMTNEYLPRL